MSEILKILTALGIIGFVVNMVLIGYYFVHVIKDVAERVIRDKEGR